MSPSNELEFTVRENVYENQEFYRRTQICTQQVRSPRNNFLVRKRFSNIQDYNQISFSKPG